MLCSCAATTSLDQGVNVKLATCPPHILCPDDDDDDDDDDGDDDDDDIFATTYRTTLLYNTFWDY